MPELRIKPLGDGKFEVRVDEGLTSTVHEVTVGSSSLEDLEWQGTPEELLRKSFQFLLEREPKESILSSFDITDISAYFPEYRDAIRG